MNKQWKVRLLWPHVSHVYCWTFIIYVCTYLEQWAHTALGFLPHKILKLTLVLVVVLGNICNFDCKLLQIPLYFGYMYDEKIHYISVSLSKFLCYCSLSHFPKKKDGLEIVVEMSHCSFWQIIGVFWNWNLKFWKSISDINLPLRTLIKSYMYIYPKYYVQ